MLAIALIWACWLPGAGAQAADEDPVRIGVLAFRGAEHVTRTWGATAEYLSRAVPERRFEIEPLPLATLRAATSAGRIDYVLTNPGQYVELEEDFGISRIATLKKSISEGARNQFGAVILARSNRSDIRRLADLKGKVFGAVSRNAFGGFQMAWREFKAAGLDPFELFSDIRYFGFPQDAIVLAVRDGSIDAGTVRTGLLESMARQGVVALEDFKVLNPRKVPGVDVAISTRLYPEWPFAKMPHASAELSERVAIALLSLPEDSAAMRAAGASGWTVPLDYKPVHDLFRELEIGPYARGDVSLADVLMQYWEWALFAAVLLVLVIMHGVRTEYLVQRRTRQLSDLNQELAHEVEVRRGAEARARRHQSELAHVSRVNVIGEMTSGLAHELRQPLAAIHNYAEGSRQRLSRRGDPAEISGALDHILEQAGRASAIVSRVRGYMRKRTPKHEAVDINHAIHEACGFMHHDLEAAGIAVDLDLGDGLPAVTGDLIELEQLIINICRNALDALGEGPAPKTIAVSSVVTDGAVEVVIEDNGPGILDEDIDAVWEPFVTRKERGLGLGLAICRSIVEAHGGVIRARNRETGGFSVAFAIPAAEQESRHKA